MRDPDAATIRLADYQPPDYFVDQIALTFELDATTTLVSARSHIRRRGGEPRPLVMNGERLDLQSICIDRAPLEPDAYMIEPGRLTIYTPPEAFELEIVTRINPAANTALEGLYMSGGRYCTQCEAEGFRAITFALDRPDVLSRYSVRIEADKSFPTLLSNGNLIEQGELPNGRHFAVWDDPHPKPCYLFALAAGAYDTISDEFITRSGRKVALAIHVDPGEAGRAAYAMDSLKRSMAWDEQVFGREYDLDIFNIVAVRDFNFGAMENKGLNIFNSSLILANSDTATDADYEAIEAVVGHEYFHNWTGNRITCRDWFQLCLKEGLTVFREQEFSADQRSHPVQRIKDVKRLRARQYVEDAGPLAHPVRPSSYQKINNFYTATVYEKGGEIIRMLKALIGADAFKRGMDLYFERCDGTAATVEQFLACFAESSGRDLSHFKLWYEQAGTPRVTARTAYDAETHALTLTLKQETSATPGQPTKNPLPIPLQLGFIAANGAHLAVKAAGETIAREDHQIVFAQTEQSFTFTGVALKPIPALLRGFSAPVLLDDGLSITERLAQMTHDPDPFTRWEAGQAIARALMLEDHEQDRRGALIEALGRELDRAQQDAAFAALTLRLPDLSELLLGAPNPDPDALYARRESLRRAIATAHKDRLVALATQKTAEPFSASADAAGQRALKSAALDLIAALGGDEVDALERAFTEAGSMTESIAALDALGASGSAAFEPALNAFYERWRVNPLVLDKWFSVQAAAPRADALERVARLRAHPNFELRNPNRVRALGASFAMRNPRAFHDASGAGYAFLAKLARDIDPLNPALSSRLLTPFETWKRFDTGRQAKARAELEALKALTSLSPTARETVERTLA
jgi:aminopeptidase N